VTDLGGVFTWAGYGTSHEGFDAEWRNVEIMTVDGDLLSRAEVFDEADLDAALAKFDQLSQPARRLENAASQVAERHSAHFAARDWDALAKVLADDICIDDRRRAVNAGIKHGRDAEIANLRAVADVGITYTAFVVIAARGERLILTRASVGGGGAAEYSTDALSVVEINSHSQIAAIVIFDLDDFESAFEELEARYLAGEAAAYSQTWSLFARTYAAVNRHELPPTTPDWVNVDNRRVTAFAPGDMTPYIRATWDVAPDLKIYIEAVHRLSNLGAVVTHKVRGISKEGFEAEWREISLGMMEGGQFNRSELFDEADLDAAIARFDQLSQPARQLENAASHAADRYLAQFAARDWDALAKVLADDISTDDRRRVVNAGIRHGRDAEIASLRAYADVGVMYMTSVAMAARGERLILVRASGGEGGSREFLDELLAVVEINSHNQISAIVVFDLDDFDSAMDELDRRYLSGEAAANANTWRVISGSYAAINRHERPATTTDWINVEHRREIAMGPADLFAYIGAGTERNPDIYTYVETVHRLDSHGVVVTYAAQEASQEGFAAEWRGVALMTVEGDLINRSEIFDEADLDAALARFDQLGRPAPRLENTATRVFERLYSYVAVGDWHAVTQITAENVCVDDRRRVVNAGILHGRDANIKDAQATVAVGFTMTMLDVLATRGGRLALTGVRVAGRDPEAIQNDALQIVEIDAEERIAGVVVFDLDDFDAASGELDARYIAGEAADHAATWSVIAGVSVAHNRREIAATTSDVVSIDHRRVAGFAPGEGFEYIRAGWDLGQNLNIYIEIAHRLNDLGAVFTWAGYGTSREGFDAEWRGVTLMTVDGEMVSRMEVFDEGDLDAALAKFDQLARPAPRLDNAASRMGERYLAHIAAGEWDAMAEILADNFSSDDRRRVVGAGVRHGRDAVILDMRAIADLALMKVTSTVMATRGERLVLMGAQYSGRNRGPEGAFLTEVLGIFEIDADERIVAAVSFDVDDVEAAIAELDARYTAGEAAPYVHAWSIITRAYTALNRREALPTTPDWINIDHRHGPSSFAPGQLPALLASWNLAPHISSFSDAVHRLNNRGAVIGSASYETSQEGVSAEWRAISVLTVEGDLIDRLEVFDEAELDTAIARFEELDQARRVENTASRTVEQFLAHFAVREWDAMAELLSDDISSDDRRSVVNAGVRRGRDAEMANWHATGDVWSTHVTSTVVATRGERLALIRFVFTGQDQSKAFDAVAHAIIEIDDDNRVAAVVVFDPDEIDAAFAELDTRYIAGEAAVHARTWSVIARAFAALNQHEFPATTPGWVNIDHRSVQRVEAGDPGALIRAAWDVVPHGRVYIEAVHRLSDIGVVTTYVARGTSQEGFDAEWRAVNISMADGDMISRSEVFDEADLDAALATFEELHPEAPRLENAASQVGERFLAHFAARDWDAMAEMLADNFSQDDRRRVVGAGVRHGRDAQIVDMRAIADLGTKYVTPTAIATRGERLVLMRHRLSFGDQGPEAFLTEVLVICEINTEERIVASVSFDIDDVDAAFEELDARYLAGEAAAHAHTWSVITQVYAALNRQEMPATTPDWVVIDHRRGIGFAPSDATAYISARQDPQGSVYVETVTRLSNLGAVFTWAGHATSQEGFEAEWRGINVLTVEGDLINRGEIFDEADIDAALAKFEELNRPTPRLGNVASRIVERYQASFAARDWAAMTELLADDIVADDRRRVVNAGIRRGRDVHIADTQAAAEIGDISSSIIAIRGERLALAHVRTFNRGLLPGEVAAEMLGIAEIDADERIAAFVVFDVDDIDAAFAELEARYLAGEASDYAHTWSVIALTTAAFNRHELPEVDWVTIDHRQLAPIDASDLPAAIRAIWDVTPDLSTRIEAVHRLSSFGAVVTYTAYGTSIEGFAAEWRMVDLLGVEGDRFSRFEFFDEADLDAALARFEELHPPTRQLENTATRVYESLHAYFVARDWDGITGILADGYYQDDRRPFVGAGVGHGQNVLLGDLRIATGLGITNAASNAIATRGERLALTRAQYSSSHAEPEAFYVEFLQVVEIDAKERITALAAFDIDDFEAAFQDLDARYLAGEAAAHSSTWSVNLGFYAGFNRHELPATTPDWIYIDHRPLVTIEANDLPASMRAIWDLAPDISIYIETVHRLSDLGAVVTAAVYGRSHEGFDAEWRMIDLFTVEGDLISRCEIFDEANIDAALARFEELDPQTRRLENPASRLDERLFAHWGDRQFDAIAEILADDSFVDDRRRGINAGLWQGRDVVIAHLRALAGGADSTSTVIAIRGKRLALSRVYFANRDLQQGDFGFEMLSIIEIDAEHQIAAHIVFDLDDVDAAFEELDARYLAGEAAAHANTWSVLVRIYAAFNRHELYPTTPDWVNADHRRGIAFASGDMTAYLRAGKDLTPDTPIYAETVHRLSDFGAVVTQVMKGTSRDGFDAEWQEIGLFTFDGDLISRCELFDEADLDAALAKFDELDRQTPLLENAATRVWARATDAVNRRDMDGLLALASVDHRFEDRRKGLRDLFEGPVRGREAVRALFETVPSSWRLEVEPIAIRGARLSLTRACYRDIDDADRPIAVELLQITEVSDDDLVRAFVNFDPDDINSAFAELTARWIASGEVAYPAVIESVDRINATINRHDWDAVATHFAGAEYVNHRQPAHAFDGTITNWLSSRQTTGSLVPNLWVELAEVLARCAIGIVGRMTLKGTSAEGAAIEIPFVVLILLDGERVTRLEAFDEDQRDLALARLQELNRPV